jgi:hypothetical protein
MTGYRIGMLRRVLVAYLGWSLDGESIGWKRGDGVGGERAKENGKECMCCVFYICMLCREL